MTTESDQKPRVPSRETLATRAFGKVQRARREWTEAKKSALKAADRHAKRINEKLAAFQAAEKAAEKAIKAAASEPETLPQD